jgi:hypothetical protein
LSESSRLYRLANSVLPPDGNSWEAMMASTGAEAVSARYDAERQAHATICSLCLPKVMITPLSVSDFKMTLAVCEVRYENAYLIYDRTGFICDELRKLFTGLNVINASPNQTVLQAEEGSFVLELTQSRFTSQKPDSNLETFGAHAKRFFTSILYSLDVKVFTRVGLRVFFRKEFKDLAEAKAAFARLKLVDLKPMERFGAASEPHEILLRWEGDQIGTTLRLKAETGKIDVILPPEIQPERPEIHKSINGLILDVDYYTVAPVERSQWDASAWIPQSIRTIRKGSDSIFGN